MEDWPRGTTLTLASGRQALRECWGSCCRRIPCCWWWWSLLVLTSTIWFLGFNDLTFILGARHWAVPRAPQVARWHPRRQFAPPTHGRNRTTKTQASDNQLFLNFFLFIFITFLYVAVLYIFFILGNEIVYKYIYIYTLEKTRPNQKAFLLSLLLVTRICQTLTIRGDFKTAMNFSHNKA